MSLDQDKDNDESPDFEQLAGNPLHKNIQRQLQVCSDVVERITVEHHGSLNSSVQAMGGVARHYNQTRANVGTLREQLRECKQLLQTGSSQTDVRELWQRKLQYSLVLRLLGALDMIKVHTWKMLMGYIPSRTTVIVSLSIRAHMDQGLHGLAAFVFWACFCSVTLRPLVVVRSSWMVKALSLSLSLVPYIVQCL